MKLIYTIIFIFYSISLLNCFEIDSFKQDQHQLIKEYNNLKENRGSVIECLINQALPSCQYASGGFTCPTISGCLRSMARIPNQISYQVLIPGGSYFEKDCPGVYGQLGISGILFFIGWQGQAIFNCGKSQFISFDSGNSTLDVFIDGLDLQGNSKISGGSINIFGGRKASALSSITIINVSGEGSSATNNGGFLSTTYGKVYIINSNFKNNTVENSGGVFNAPNAFILSLNSTFIGNSAIEGNGGALYGYNASIVNSTFNNNSADIGGAVNTIGPINVVNSSFSDNSATYGGGIFSIEGVNVDNSFFQYNFASDGGAIFGINLTVSNSIFESNQAINRGSGGAIYASSKTQTNMTVYNCTFYQNEADGVGGGIYSIGTSLLVSSSQFDYNRAKASGAGIFAAYGTDYISVDVIDSSFTYNTAELNGGAIAIYGQFLVNLYESVFDSNSAGLVAGGIYFTNYPKQLLGGVFTNSMSNEPGSTTFYSDSIIDANIANVTIPNSQTSYSVTLFDEESFTYIKAIGVIGSCFNGVATIDQYGTILKCTCLGSSTGPSCDN
ncbi:polymorphic outer membrane protein [Heterostelium album PN500]|uniref:Polymorphic outer membrane protein n=1 Tax=Heterostelium pallidum (strain ATCC 26659 / Pp 5 / PN500) TaxID=670386 RepID=D3BD49_HETP5|nr:polymorphic outer membrane protein [Heterostelium album PN500]EFA80841.1 polymorphic outer membrane protein [Heterostelium album PN500]|eukprot:XP_020432960.1 polymorphic outer membrane protein [Heterostelium album PN500]